MKQDNNLRNNLKSIRTRLGMSQQDLANIAGVTRQTISGVESGQYAPSVAITLRLAKALGCQVEDLFWLEQDLPEIEAVLTKEVPLGQQFRLSLARVGGQWIAYPLVGRDAFRQDMIPADGETVAVDGFPGISKLSFPEGVPAGYPKGEGVSQKATDKVRVRLLDDNIAALHNTVVIAGCSPVISLWARATERWHPQLRVQYNFANSMAALHSLCRGEAHIAGMHLYDPETGEYNIPFVREVLAGREAVMITLGVWEEGLLVQSGNPKGIKSVTNLVETQATIVNRELGSGSRMLLEQTLQKEQVPFDAIHGFEQIVRSHQDVAEAVASGMADAGISTASVATAFGLGFVPMHQSRYDLVILKEYLEEAPVQQLLNTLGHKFVHSQLEVLGGYDTSNIGAVVATIGN
ncbi:MULTISPECIES: substrate-binding domain-containing protein [unclassified Tolypothrix]|uniref:substrate-binding domain-containing protein n=1 Tax=unclassified Tolypothrix TaxID=2649714 RepID=UPI0005EABDAE|nr:MULTISPECIES: substrate-binding domain-containing protein [unclassified Tolypothrix]EKF04238.1 putative transcriptional regulator [Tolypothrix sp. PCC 7601]MBE9080886.1 helix-turn-helix domain-containing protein [Tolypothrix sp. LEGE 11397]UYD25322.1 helix-turn-helix domain-containing protein [Tolypothrix sp. PCC 7712]UYD32434.1 helix-turn-helix domain-containing protein [Tolypothrix sp. PCC 7601]